MEKLVYYIVEYMEEELSDWSFHELIQMHRYLSRHPQNRLIVSNFAAALQDSGEEGGSNLAKLLDYLSSPDNHDSTHKTLWLLGESIFSCIDDKKSALVVERFYQPLNSQTAVSQDGRAINVPAGRICLLDMRAKQELAPGDGATFDAFVFGGILGDHPPRDRTGPLRSHFPQSRKLHELQMSTDTAVLVTDIVVSEGKMLSELPFLTEPEVYNPNDKDNTVTMEGFVYVSDRYDLNTGQIRDAKAGGEQPIMNDNIKQTLLFVDFDFDLM